MAEEYDRTDAFRGASFTDADLTGATFRACDLRQIKIVDSWLVNVNVSGVVGSFVVNRVDVAAFLEAELDGDTGACAATADADRRRLPRDVGNQRAALVGHGRSRRAAARTDSP